MMKTSRVGINGFDSFKLSQSSTSNYRIFPYSYAIQFLIRYIPSRWCIGRLIPDSAVLPRKARDIAINKWQSRIDFNFIKKNRIQEN